MTEKFHQSGLRVITAAIAVALAVSSAMAADITLRSRATAGGTVVRLGDVAEIRAAMGEDAQQLASLPLMPAPAPGRARFLRMREVQDLLAAHGEDLRRHDFRGEAVVEIEAAAPGSESGIRDAALQANLRRRGAWEGRAITASETRTTAPALSPTDTARLQDQLTRTITEYLSRTSGRKAEWQVTPQVGPADWSTLATAKSPLHCAGGNSPWTGRQRLVISFTSPDGEARVPVYADVTAVQSVVVAVRPIERGAVLAAADVEVQTSNNPRLMNQRGTPVESVEALVGLETTRTIQAGAVVLSDDLRSPLLVKRGEEITVIARGGGIQVRVIARARQDGARGELIAVESLETKERFDAVVVGQREAIVFAASSAPASGETIQRQVNNLRK